MTTRTITAIYDSEGDARLAREQLLRNGVDDNDVQIVSQNLTETRAGSDSSGSDKGVWESIKDFFVGDDDRPVYAEGLRRGGYLLTARVEDGQSDEAIATLERTNAIDLDQRTEQWRAEGWSEEPRYTDAATTQGYSGRADDERSIPIAEERLRVGKREVDRGGLRVRSYVVEEPVHEEVRLREERVDVERRPASGGAAAGADPFREQTVEVSERGEEAVVAKDAVVTEEVVVRKETDERIESIDDTVRHTEVDVDDARTPPGTRRSRNSRGDSRKSS